MSWDFLSRESPIINLLYSAGRTSAKPDVDVVELLRKIISENIYKSDYKDITEKLLEEDLNYETVIPALKQIAESGIFAN